MQIKKFSSPTVPEALDQVRRELGEDAIILSTRRVGDHPSRFEITAAAEEIQPASFPRVDREGRPLDRSRSSRGRRSPPPDRESGPVLASPARSTGSHTGTAVAASAVAPIPAARPREGVVPTPREPEAVDRARLLEEIRDLKSRLGTMTQYLLSNTPDDLSQEARLVHLRLIETGLDPHLATALVRRATKRGGDLEPALRDEIARAVPVGGGIESGAGQQVIALVGPTGVGKTTTCAKLAANLTLSERRSVALISADAFRVGGAHQLGFYADILEVPFHSAHDRPSLLAAIRACGGAEIVLVDTTGRSGSDGEGIRSVGEMLDADPRVQRWLALSAVASTVDNLGALRTFNRVRPSGLVLTKFDESHAHGAVTTVAIRSKLPLRYVTNGQTVPDDHEVADRDLLPRLLLEGRGR